MRFVVGVMTLVLAGCAHPSPHGTARAPSDSTRPALNTQGKTLAQLFQGRAGVAVLTVGDGVRLRIRGNGDFNGNGDPLFIIDGAPVRPPNGVLSMNPADIVNIEILKDDGSTAIYGIQGANGVVKITTRRR